MLTTVQYVFFREKLLLTIILTIDVQSVNPEAFTEKLVDVVVGMDIPFDAVEHESFQALVQFLNPNAPLISRRTIRRSIQERAEEYRRKLQDDMPKNHSISISTDGEHKKRRHLENE